MFCFALCLVCRILVLFLLPIIGVLVFFLMIRRPPRSTQSRSSAASDVYKRQDLLVPSFGHVQLDQCGTVGINAHRPVEISSSRGVPEAARSPAALTSASDGRDRGALVAPSNPAAASRSRTASDSEPAKSGLDAADTTSVMYSLRERFDRAAACFARFTISLSARQLTCAMQAC